MEVIKPDKGPALFSDHKQEDVKNPETHWSHIIGLAWSHISNQLDTKHEDLVSVRLRPYDTCLLTTPF